MNYKQSEFQIQWRRGELIAELFLQELSPIYLARPTTDFGYDFFMGFQNDQGGVDTYGVEVKATQRDVRGRYQLRASILKRLAFSNIPTMLLIVDVKRNELFYTWLRPEMATDIENKRSVTVKVKHIDDVEKRQLKALLTGI